MNLTTIQLRPILPVLLLLTPALFAVDANKPLQAPRKKLSAISLLPNGSQLKGVMFPRYDADQHLVSALRAEFMTLVDDEHVSGETVTILFYNSDQTARGRVNLTHAIFNQVKGTLKADELVTLNSDHITARGHGLNYSLEKSEGFLSGPIVTLIQAPNETTMNSSQSPLRATSILGLSLLMLPASASPPPMPTTEERAAIQTDAMSAAPAHADGVKVTKANLREDLTASAAATAAAKEFIERSELPEGELQPAPPQEDLKPLDIKSGPKDTLVTCDGGMYFDVDNGVIVYLKNVRITDPRFDLTGANEMKIFLSRKQDTPGKSGENTNKPSEASPGTIDNSSSKNKLGLSAKFGDVDRIVATGAVRVLQKDVEPGKLPVEASGAIFTYHPKDGQIILTGGYPWVKQGTSFMRAKEPELVLRIQRTGAFVTEGNWEMGGRIDQIEKKH